MNRPAWWLPDLAFVAACVTLFYCLFLFQGYRKLFHDSDAGWHIRSGEAILASGTVPRIDPYSFTRGGQPWFAWEWLADAIAGAVHRVAGLRGVTLWYGAAIAAGVWLWFQVHWVLDGSFLLAGAMAVLLLSTCDLHWLARPHVLGWLFLLGSILWAERRAGKWGWRDGVFVGVLAAVWANVHGSFFLAPVIFGIYGVGSWADATLTSRDRKGAGGEGGSATRDRSVSEVAPPLPYGRGSIRGRDQMRGYFMACGIALIAPLANPYGWGLYEHVVRYLGDSQLLAQIGEFQSFDFHAAGAGQIIAALIIGMLGGGLALSQGRMAHCFLAVLFTALALRSARGLPLAALVLLPLANAALTRWMETSPLRAFVDYSRRLRTLDMRFSGVALAPIVLLGCWWLLGVPAIAADTGFPASEFPVTAYSHLAEGGRLFAPDKFGGYLIYRSNGTRKVFMDGRSDLYGAEFLRRYARMMQVRPGWREYWESFHFTEALLPKDAPLGPALVAMGWKPVFQDRTSTLLQEGGN